MGPYCADDAAMMQEPPQFGRNRTGGWVRGFADAANIVDRFLLGLFRINNQFHAAIPLLAGFRSIRDDRVVGAMSYDEQLLCL
jgi:hypothetical protein